MASTEGGPNLLNRSAFMLNLTLPPLRISLRATHSRHRCGVRSPKSTRRQHKSPADPADPQSSGFTSGAKDLNVLLAPARSSRLSSEDSTVSAGRALGTLRTSARFGDQPPQDVFGMFELVTIDGCSRPG